MTKDIVYFEKSIKKTIKQGFDENLLSLLKKFPKWEFDGLTIDEILRQSISSTYLLKTSDHFWNSQIGVRSLSSIIYFTDGSAKICNDKSILNLAIIENRNFDQFGSLILKDEDLEQIIGNSFSREQLNLFGNKPLTKQFAKVNPLWYSFNLESGNLSDLNPTINASTDSRIFEIFKNIQQSFLFSGYSLNDYISQIFNFPNEKKMNFQISNTLPKNNILRPLMLTNCGIKSYGFFDQENSSEFYERETPPILVGIPKSGIPYDGFGRTDAYNLDLIKLGLNLVNKNKLDINTLNNYLLSQKLL